jgi:hypothetical protein
MYGNRHRVRRSGPKSLDMPTLVGGLAATGVGVLLLLDSVGALRLSFGWLGPALLAAIGAYLLAAGLAQRSR